MIHFHSRYWEMVFHSVTTYISMGHDFLEREVRRQECALLSCFWLKQNQLSFSEFSFQLSCSKQLHFSEVGCIFFRQ